MPIMEKLKEEISNIVVFFSLFTNIRQALNVSAIMKTIRIGSVKDSITAHHQQFFALLLRYFLRDFHTDSMLRNHLDLVTLGKEFR